MEDKIEVTIAYYTKKGQDILDAVNSRNDLTADELIHYGEEMAIIEYKLTALEVANEN
ncbi:hypothetical protein DFQ10_101275 [Winogradskyella eximia]|jgi:hypothetical protein|uniref:Uncharacterized protein n=1 Tax=Winogradskyella eximia TaxID=262006 RepID=A0A3D9HAJ3_9FLAO|nr:hypothetical protein [Winogradskyella eximia]RED46504.1 hypothetical protein DFQ10_101275 [Winogradskyella eximia]|tara:strand:- start:147 stop:320 length:174 start_codon:yes stop_codon:yes gene_type:complete